jgi:hypothetical protein
VKTESDAKTHPIAGPAVVSLPHVAQAVAQSRFSPRPAQTQAVEAEWRIRQDLNLQPSDPKSEALSN